MGIARERYEALRGVRSQFLDVARAASHLTLPYLIKYDSDYTETHKRLITPWQSVGAKCVTALAAKLMLAILPPPPTPTPAPQVATDNNPRRLTPDSDGSNLKIKKKSRKRRQELSKGTGQLRINPTQSANVSTAGQAAASGGINV